MGRRTIKNPIGENWVKKETVNKRKDDAKVAAEKHAKWEATKIIIAIPHPNSPRAIILKYT